MGGNEFRVILFKRSCCQVSKEMRAGGSTQSSGENPALAWTGAGILPPGAHVHPRGAEIFDPERPGCLLLLGDHPGPHGQGRGPAEIREWWPRPGQGTEPPPSLSSSRGHPAGTLALSRLHPAVAEGSRGKAGAGGGGQRRPCAHRPAPRRTWSCFASRCCSSSRGSGPCSSSAGSSPTAWCSAPRTESTRS